MRAYGEGLGLGILKTLRANDLIAIRLYNLISPCRAYTALYAYKVYIAAFFEGSLIICFKNLKNMNFL